jgi:transcriptional regulator with XRE-family HTH domain
MFETDKLRGRIIEKFGSQNAFSAATGNSISFISQYLNGHTVLDQKIMSRWIELLEIPDSEIDQYFFKRKVHDTEQEPA